MLKCKEIVANATDYIDEHQSWGQSMGMAMHLLMCGNCRRFINYFKLFLLSLKNKQTISQEDANLISSEVIAKSRSDNK